MAVGSVVLLEDCRDGGEDEEEGGDEGDDADKDGEDAEDAEVLQKEHRAAAAEHQDVARDADQDEDADRDPEEHLEGRVRVGGVPVLVADQQRKGHGRRDENGEPELFDDLVDVVHGGVSLPEGVAKAAFGQRKGAPPVGVSLKARPSAWKRTCRRRAMGARDSLLFRETGAVAPFGRFSVMSCPRIVGFAEGFVCRGGAYHTAPAGDKQNPVAAALRTERRCDGGLAFWPCMQ